MDVTEEEVYSVVPCVARLGYFGYWHRGASGGAAGNYLRGWVCCALVTSISVSIAEKLIADMPTDLAELTMTLFELTIPLTVVSKGVFFILQRETIHKLVDLLVDMRWRYAERDGGPERRKACYLHALAVQRVLLVMALSIVSAWLMTPLLPHVLPPSSQHNGSSVPWQLPLPLWLPGGVQRSPLYESLYLLQAACVLASLLSASAMDAFFCNVTLTIAAELHVLNDNVSSPGGRQPEGELKTPALGLYSEDEAAVPQFEKVATEEARITSRNQTRLSLVENIRHHQAILRCIDLLESSMKYSIPFQLLNSVTSMCFVLFVCSMSLQNGSGLSSVFKSILCIPYLIFETGIYCIYAQEILDQSEELVQSAVNYEYIEAGADCSKTLLIFMLMVSTPKEIKVSKIVPLSKPTFLQILNGSYTLINLLYHFSVPEE